MPEITLESLAARLEAVEKKLANLNRVRDESRSSEATNIAASLLVNIRCGKRQNSDSQLGRGLTSVVPAVRDWRSVVGISEENDFTREMYAEMESRREAERSAARQGVEE